MKSALTMFCAVALAVGPSIPASAQDGSQGDRSSGGTMPIEQGMAEMSALFETEPLTAEQRARLPLASQVVAKIMPEGAMADMMDDMFDGFLGSMMAMASGSSATVVSEKIGFDPATLDLADEDTALLASIFDPAWEERQSRELAIFPDIMSHVLMSMEPTMRTAMTELYAINFSNGELEEIDAFFATDTGANFARKSFTMASDPRIMKASIEAMPAMMERMGDMEARLAQATADLPAEREFGDLSSSEKAQVLTLTGLSSAEIEQAIAAETEEDSGQE